MCGIVFLEDSERKWKSCRVMSDYVRYYLRDFLGTILRNKGVEVYVDCVEMTVEKENSELTPNEGFDHETRGQKEPSMLSSVSGWIERRRIASASSSESSCLYVDLCLCWLRTGSKVLNTSARFFWRKESKD